MNKIPPFKTLLPAKRVFAKAKKPSANLNKTFDFSLEEQGCYKIGNKFVKMIFPR